VKKIRVNKALNSKISNIYFEKFNYGSASKNKKKKKG
jgi:hypothetical protein